MAVLFGAAVTVYPGSGRTYAQELAAHEADCGRMHILRTYDGGRPLVWNSTSGVSGSINPQQNEWEIRASWHSMKPNIVDLASGALDSWIDDYVASIPVTGVKRLLTVWHEPEVKIKDGVFTAAQWKQAATRFGQRVKAAGHPDVLVGPVFTSKFTLGVQPYHVPAIMASDPADLFAVSDFVGWDPYNEASKSGSYGPTYSVGYYLDDVVEWTATNAGLPVAIGETGFVPDPADLTRRPAWLTALANYADAEGFLACCYFDASITNPWWLRIAQSTAVPDAPSIAAWADAYSRDDMAWLHVGSRQAGGQNNTTINIAWPNDIPIHEGDVAFLWWNHSTSHTETPPAGFELVNSYDANSGSQRMSFWRKVCAGGESGNLALTLSGTTRVSATLTVIRGANPDDPISGWALLDETVSGTSHACPAVNVAYENGVVLTAIGERVTNGTTNFAPPSGYTEVADSDGLGTGTGGTTTAVAHDGLADGRTPGSVTPPNWTGMVATANVVTWSVALRPAIPIPPATLVRYELNGVAGGTTITNTTGGPGDTPPGSVQGIAPTVDSTGLTPPRVKFDQGTPPISQASYLVWQHAATQQGAWRWYPEFSEHGTSGQRVAVAWSLVSAAAAWMLDIDSAGLLVVRNGVGVATATSAVPIPEDERLRIEVTYDTGEINVRVYNSADALIIGLSPVHPVATIEQFWLGNTFSSGDVGPSYADNLMVRNTPLFIGPYVPPPVLTEAWTEWNGATEDALTLDGVWDGSTIQPVTFETVL